MNCWQNSQRPEVFGGFFFFFFKWRHVGKLSAVGSYPPTEYGQLTRELNVQTLRKDRVIFASILRVCVCASTRMHAHSCVHRCIYACAYLCVWRPRGSLTCHFSGAIHCYFLRQSLSLAWTWPSWLSCLASEQAGSVSASQCWGYKHMPPFSAFKQKFWRGNSASLTTQGRGRLDSIGKFF